MFGYASHRVAEPVTPMVTGKERIDWYWRVLKRTPILLRSPSDALRLNQ